MIQDRDRRAWSEVGPGTIGTVAASQTITNITPEEYLKAERKAEFRGEFRDGRVFAMAGGHPRDHRIATNVTASLVSALEGGSCWYGGARRGRG